MATGKDLTEVSTFTAAVHVPKTGEDVSAATLEVPLQALTNRTRILKNRADAVDVVTGVHTDEIADLIAADVAFAASAAANSAADAAMTTRTNILRGASPRLFQFNCSDGANPAMWDFQVHMGEWTQVAVATPVCPLIVNIVGIPKGSVISEIRVTLKATAHGSLIPTSLPSFQFTKCNTTTGGSMIANASDVGPVASYDTTHQIIMPSLNETIDDTANSYSVRLFGEGGANALDGALRVFGVHVYFTPIA